MYILRAQNSYPHTVRSYTHVEASLSIWSNVQIKWNHMLQQAITYVLSINSTWLYERFQHGHWTMGPQIRKHILPDKEMLNQHKTNHETMHKRGWQLKADWLINMYRTMNTWKGINDVALSHIICSEKQTWMENHCRLKPPFFFFLFRKENTNWKSYWREW